MNIAYPHNADVVLPWAANAISGVVALASIAGVVGSFLVRRFRSPRGPMEQGTAEVLSLRQWGSLSVNTAVPRVICRIAVRVYVPGREAYRATVWRNVDPWDIGAVEPGRTVAVDIDSGKPQRVRIDLSRQVSRPIAFKHVAPQSNSLRTLPSADLLTSGQRVSGVLKSFTVMRSCSDGLGRPELVDTARYLFEVEFGFPNLTPFSARSVQQVPLKRVPQLAIGLKLACAVDPADPSRRFVVDWAHT